ncbi:hypothetical protein Dsin_008299 [Dipteronia sinensis]|uniref:Uncharacterized protein n=1 Tax=Dipteronia sinensis TaxID=43782 RepID=A0AAE0EAT4_9ROSI|nr:hypothetical protein Dsin_008299 [Dipteronia sinensis]
MNLQEQQEISPSLSVLSRLDRLNNLVQLLEEIHSSSGVIRRMKKENEFMTLSSALEEDPHEAHLIERLTLIDNQVLQEKMIFIVIFGGLDLFFYPVKLGDGSRKHIRVKFIQIPEKIEDKSDFEQQGALVIQESIGW